MSDIHQQSNDPFDTWHGLFESVRSQFEAACSAAEIPRVEEYLDGWTEPAYSSLLRELLRLEIKTRRQRGEELSIAVYENRFADHHDIVTDVFYSTVATTTALPQATFQRETFDDFELLQEIARGGMGVVYKARQVKLDRIVALKMILAGQLASEAETRRFRVEAHAAAKLDHPGIVPIYTVGEHDGRQFFSMGFVDGESLAARLRDGPLTAMQAAKLTRLLAKAVAYAHEHGVIHRDLKPANVLLDHDGQPRITDFGLAKRLEADAGLTGTGQILGTPSYMPPEQATGRQSEVGYQSDVYSLGATLYHLITGRPPFQAPTIIETLKQVVEYDPVAPRRLNPRIPRDLETICLKCLEKELTLRYRSAAELERELGRYVDGLPIRARPIGLFRQAAKWAKRRPGIAVMLFTILLISGLGVSGILWQWVRAETYLGDARANERTANFERDRAQQEMRREVARRLASQAYLEADHFAQRAVLLAAEAVRATANDKIRVPAAEQALRDALESCTGVGYLAHDDSISRVFAGSNGDWIVTASEDRTARMREFVAFRDERRSTILHNGTNFAHTCATSPDGKWLVTGVKDKPSRLWDLSAAPEAGRSYSLHDSQYLMAVTFSADGHRLVTAFDGGEVRLYGLTPRFGVNEPLVLHSRHPRVAAMAVSSDNRWLVTAPGPGSDNRSPITELWDLGADDVSQNVRLLRGHTKGVLFVAISPDNRWLVTASSDNSARLWDLTSADPSEHSIQLPHPSSFLEVRFSPDSRWLICRLFDSAQAIRLWNITTPDPLERFFDLNNKLGIDAMAATSDGKYLVTGGFDGKVVRWEMISDDPSRSFVELSGHTDRVRTIAVSSDGGFAATGSDDGTVRLWRLDTPDPGMDHHILRGHEAPINDLFITSDNQRLVSGSDDKTVRIWDLSLSNPANASVVAQACEGQRLEVVTSDFGHTAITAVPVNDNTNTTAIRSWDMTAMDPRKAAETIMHVEGEVRHLVMSPNRRWMVTLTGKGPYTARLWELPRAETPRLEVTSRSIDIVQCLTDSKLVTLSDEGTGQRTIRVFDLPLADPADPARVFQGDGKKMAYVVVSPACKWMAAWGNDAVIRCWDLSSSLTHDGFYELSGGFDAISRAAFGADDQCLVTNSYDKSVWVWDLAAGDPSLHPPKQICDDAITMLDTAFGPENRWLLAKCVKEISSASGRTEVQRSVRLWDLGSRNLVDQTVLPDDSEIYSFAVSADRRWLVTGSRDRVVRVWELSRTGPQKPVVQLRGHAANVSAVAVTDDNHWIISGSEDRTVRLWDMTDLSESSEPIVLHGYRNPVNRLIVGPDSRWLISADLGVQGSARASPMRLADLLKEAQNACGRNLTVTEWKRFLPAEPYRKTFD